MATIRTLDELRKARAKRRAREMIAVELPLAPMELPPTMKVKIVLHVEDGDVSVALEKVRGSPDFTLTQVWSCLWYAQMRVEQGMESQE